MSTIFLGCQIGQVRVTFKSDEAQRFHLEVLSLQGRKSFEYFFYFHQTLGISFKDLEEFKADIAFIYTALAYACDFARNFDFCNAKISLVRALSGDCLERVFVRKSFCIKKFINKISLHLSN